MSVAWPWLLFLLGLPWLLRRLWPLGEPAPPALRLPFVGHLSGLITAKQPSPTKRVRWQPMLLWALLVIAAARPQWMLLEPRQASNERDLLFVIDVSTSMDSRDLALGQHPVTRLDAARALAEGFLSARPGDRAGLIVFGREAWVHTPLTRDHEALRHALTSLDVGLAGEETAIGDALTLATKRLSETGDTSRAVILVSDGANTAGSVTPQQAAWLAQRQRIRIHSVLVTGDGAPAETLAEIATLTGGIHARITDNAALASFLGRLDAIEPAATRLRMSARPHELYPWPLGGALLLFLLACYQSQRRLLRKASPMERPSR